MNRQIRHTACDHKWEKVFDSALDAAAYNDGLNYEPYFKKCARCGRKERIKPWPTWAKILANSFLILFLIGACVTFTYPLLYHDRVEWSAELVCMLAIFAWLILGSVATWLMIQLGSD